MEQDVKAGMGPARRRPRRGRLLVTGLLPAAVLLAAFLLSPVGAWVLSAWSPQFSSSVNLVEVYATVTDRQGAPVTGLQANDFEVLEDGQPQRVEAFAAGDFPLSVGLAIDYSASMAGERLPLVKQAARTFLAELRAEDQAMLIGISSDVEVLAPLSTDRLSQTRAIEGLYPWGTTSLYDAIIEGIGLVQPGRGRRALIVLSDGEDRYSTAGPDQVLAAARRASVLVYPMAIGPKRSSLFPELAVLTGGRSFHVRDPKRLQQALSDIARELRFQYLLGYEPARTLSPQPGAWHSIVVHVKRGSVQVRARDGYFG